GPGVKTITVATALPEITDQVVIDATTQPGYAGSPLIELNGFGLGGSGNDQALVISAGGSTIRGFAIYRFPLSGIWLKFCDNNVIQANYLGLDAAGTAGKHNTRGLLLSASSNNLIGGTTPAARNVISGNSFEGIELNGNNNVVQGNFIGTDPTGTQSRPNGTSGIEVSSSGVPANNLIGGTVAGAGNLISGNPTGLRINST